MRRKLYLYPKLLAGAFFLAVLLASCGRGRSLSPQLPANGEGNSEAAASSASLNGAGVSADGSLYTPGEPFEKPYKGPYRLPERRIAYTQETIDEYPMLREAGIEPGIYNIDEPIPAKSASAVDISHGGYIAPAEGVVRVLVLKVQFSSTAGNPKWNNSEISRRLFDVGSDIPGGSMRDYYYDQSYGQLTLTGDVYPSDDTYYQVSGSPNWTGGPGRGSVFLTRTQWLSLMAQADPDVNFARYDADSNGNVDALLVLYRNFDDNNDQYDYYEHREYVGVVANGVSLSDVYRDGKYMVRGAFLDHSGVTDYDFVSFHEYGHILGLPDYYDYGGDVRPGNPGPDGDESNGNGYWELMAAGNYVWPPQNLSALNKYILDWDTPTNVTNNAHDVRISPVEWGQGNIYRLWKNGIEGPEYFLLENRGTSGEWIVSYLYGNTYYPSQLYIDLMPRDLRLLPPGLLIWHVDERVFYGDIPGQSVGDWGWGANDYEEHKFLDLEESGATYSLSWNGKSIVDSKYYYGGTYDPWPQSLNGTHNRFAPDTTPNSDSYDGELTYVEVADIRREGSDILADLTIGGPDIEFDFPSPAVLSGVVTLTPSLATNISSVTYTIDGNLVATLENPPYALEFDTTSYDFAQVHLRAVASNVDVPQTDTFEIDLIIDNTGGAFPQVVELNDSATEIAGTSLPSETVLQQSSDDYQGTGGSYGLHRDIGGYSDDLRALAVLPLVDLTEETAPTMVFYQHYNLESGPDTVSVVVSDDGFVSYSVAKTQAGSDAVYTGYRADWQRVHVNLAPWAGQEVHIGFLVETNGNTAGEEPSELAGWWVDHIVIAMQYTDSVPQIISPGINAGTAFGRVPGLLELDFTPVTSEDADELRYTLMLDAGSDIQGTVNSPPFEAVVSVGDLPNQSAVLKLRVLDADGVSSPAVEVPLFIYNLRSDANADGAVDEADHAAIAAAFGLTTSSAGYRPWLDSNGDGVVDERDLSSVGYDFGSSL